MVSTAYKTILSTRNAHKVQEFQEILAPLGFDISPLTDVVPDAASIEETGATFLDNAVLKAAGAWQLTGMPSLADDSGLCVDALDGAPGLFSARWAGGDDEDNNDKLLAELVGVPDTHRGAHYMCAIALVVSNEFLGSRRCPGLHLTHPLLPDGAVLIEAEGRVYGRIGHERRGVQGFGYDPLFFVPKLHQTFAEVPAAIKHEISHRGVALRMLRERLGHLTESSVGA